MHIVLTNIQIPTRAFVKSLKAELFHSMPRSNYTAISMLCINSCISPHFQSKDNCGYCPSLRLLGDIKSHLSSVKGGITYTSPHSRTMSWHINRFWLGVILNLWPWYLLKCVEVKNISGLWYDGKPHGLIHGRKNQWAVQKHGPFVISPLRVAVGKRGHARHTNAHLRGHFLCIHSIDRPHALSSPIVPLWACHLIHHLSGGSSIKSITSHTLWEAALALVCRLRSDAAPST